MSLYRIGHIVRDSFPFVWNWISSFNSFTFGLRYGRKLAHIPLLLSKYQWTIKRFGLTENLHIERLSAYNLDALTAFFRRQPESAFTYFRPHGFDRTALEKLTKDKSFLAFVICNGGSQVVGYIFLRSFFWGKCYRGYITDHEWQRMGINKQMNLFATDLAELTGMRTFGSISPKNIASMKSAQAVNDVEVIRTLENGDYFVEYKKRKHENLVR